MKRNKKLSPLIIGVFLVSCICCLLTGLYVGKKRGIPFAKREERYSIGIYTGDSPFTVESQPFLRNPVLTAADVTDVTAQFVADPFIICERGKWYMFFEVMNRSTKHGDIGLATSSDGFNWNYEQIVLDESFHISYPYVFKYQDQYYMIPESFEAYSVRLYQATEFPAHWTFVKDLVKGHYGDSSILCIDGLWWMFTAEQSDILHLFHSDYLTGPWIKHPESPIVLHDLEIARPAGRVLLFENRIFRYTQSCCPNYGYNVRAFEVTELTTETYKEKEVPESPILEASGHGWNSEGMHQIDPHPLEGDQWLACVDGYSKYWVFGFEY